MQKKHVTLPPLAVTITYNTPEGDVTIKGYILKIEGEQADRIMVEGQYDEEIIRNLKTGDYAFSE